MRRSEFRACGIGGSLRNSELIASTGQSFLTANPFGNAVDPYTIAVKRLKIAATRGDGNSFI